MILVIFFGIIYRFFELFLNCGDFVLSLSVFFLVQIIFNGIVGVYYLDFIQVLIDCFGVINMIVLVVLSLQLVKFLGFFQQKS